MDCEFDCRLDGQIVSDIRFSRIRLAGGLMPLSLVEMKYREMFADNCNCYNDSVY